MALSSYELHGERPLYAYYGSSMFIILTLGLLGNSLTLIILFHPHHRKKRMTSMMVNLCAADLLVCLLGYTVAVSYNTTDFANTGEAPALCFWLAIINCITGLASIASLTAMAVLSYLGITRNEFSQQNRMSRKLEVLLISGTWIYAIMLTIPPAFGWNRFIPIPSRISCHPDWYSSKLSDQAYIIYLTLFGFFIPLVVIICSFTGIYRYIKNTSVPQGMADESAQERQRRSIRKTLKIVIAMTLAFFISWFPYAFSGLVGSALGHESISPAYSMIPELMAKASVIYNPIIYVLLNAKFRLTLLNMLSCSWNRVGDNNTDDSDLDNGSTLGGQEMFRNAVSISHAREA